MGGFFSSIFGGSNPTLSKNIKQFGDIGSFATNMGESSLTAGTNFEQGILSGDATKVMQTLAPEISAGKKAAQEQNKTSAEMGTRSGGTTAGNAARDDTLHGQIVNLLGSLTGDAAKTLLSSGSTLLNQGTAAFQTQDAASQQQMENWSSSLFGKAMTSAASAAESFGLGKLPTGGTSPAGVDNLDALSQQGVLTPG
jgi:hypothetical protein